MMGRAGRPQYDQQGIAVILVHEPKKTFYRKFLYEPFPVESHLQEVLHDHINAEVVGGTIRSKQDAVDFLTWTYFYRRLTRNPAYYHLADGSPEAVGGYLSGLGLGLRLGLRLGLGLEFGLGLTLTLTRTLPLTLTRWAATCRTSSSRPSRTSRTRVASRWAPSMTRT